MYNAAHMSKPVTKRLSLSTKIFIAAAVIYGALVFLLPTNAATQANLGLSDAQYSLMLLLLRLPLILLASLMFYAYRRMHTYTQSIKDTPEGKHFGAITRGLAVMVWGILGFSILSAFMNSYANVNPDFRSTSLIITNYLYVIMTITSLSLISAGAHQLAHNAKAVLSIGHLRALVLLFVFFGVTFCFLISGRLQGSEAFNSFNAYYLPNILVWSTIVIPYLYAWFLGVFAAMELLLVARSTSGIIYRRALQYVAVGLVTFIAAMVVLQYFRSVIPRTGQLRLGFTLFFAYGIYLLGAISALVIARGAKRLQRIEEI